MKTPFFLFLSLLFFCCSPKQKSDMENASSIQPDAIEMITFIRDNGTVPPASYRKSQFEISLEQIAFTLYDSQEKVLRTKTINITSKNFAEIRKKLGENGITKACIFNSNEPIPPGGYSASILMKTKNKTLEHEYYVAAGNVYGCGNVVSFEDFLTEFTKDKL